MTMMMRVVDVRKEPPKGLSDERGKLATESMRRTLSSYFMMMIVMTTAYCRCGPQTLYSLDSISLSVLFFFGGGWDEEI